MTENYPNDRSLCLSEIVTKLSTLSQKRSTAKVAQKIRSAL